MNQKRKDSRSFSRKKQSYAPIMLTSKRIRPVQRQERNQYIYNPNQQSPNKSKNRDVKYKRFYRNQLKLKNQQDPIIIIEAGGILDQNIIQKNNEINRMNQTQYQIRHEKFTELQKPLSSPYKRNKQIQSSLPSMTSSAKHQKEDLYYYSNIKRVQFQNFRLRETSNSAIVKVEFNNDTSRQKYRIKNKISNSRYNISLENSMPNTKRQYKSVSINSNLNRQNSFRKDPNQFMIEINDEKGFKLISSELLNINQKKNENLQNFIKIKNPQQKFMLSAKQKPRDLTFTNFKQKIYQKKLSKLNSQKNKYNQQWHEYLNKYYLNIKKVKPIAKLGQQYEEQANISNQNTLLRHISQFNRQSKSSAQTILNQLINANRQKYNQLNQKQMFLHLSQHLNTQRNQRNAKSTNHLTLSTKNTAALSTGQISPNISPKKNQKLYSGLDQSKIQSDIINKRISLNKKDYFVFSMGDSSNQNRVQNPNVIRFNRYKDFLSKINYSNGIYVRFPDQIQKPYKYFVGKGNNSAIIKGIMRRRYWWQISDKMTSQVNFLWTQLRSNQFVKIQKKRKYQQLKLLLDPRNSNQQQEYSLQVNSLNQQLTQNYNLHKKIFKGKDLDLWIQHYKQNSKHEQKYLTQCNFNILQKRLKTLIKRKRLAYIDSTVCNSQKSHNHFECNYFLGNKKALFYAMRRYYRLNKQDPFNYIPLTFHISTGLQDSQFNQFLQKYNQVNQQRIKNKNSQIKNIWIVKPGEVTNRGRGITVCATLDQIKIRLKSKQKNSDGTLRTYILQKYIQKPFLYQKRKFDIRHYMLMSCTNGQIKGYWYQQGYIRTTSTEYNIKNCKDLYTHLTNDAIQKNSTDYGKFEKGNKISYDEFQKYMFKNYKKDFDFFVQILPKMKKLATDAIRATYSIIEPNRRENNFELFGLDFMIDENMEVYLIQCNTNPCLQLSCPLLSKIISGLIQNVFKICIDPIFPPPYQWSNSKKFQMGDNSLNEIKFQIVFNQVSDGKQLQKLYGTQKGLGSKIGKVQQEQQQYEDQEEQGEWDEDLNL